LAARAVADGAGARPVEGPPQRLRDVQKQLTHELLIQAALGLFSTQGYAATTVDELATTAGATRATFYLHFRSKADLVRELRARLQRELEPLWEPLRHLPPHPSRAAIREWLEADVDAWEAARVTTSVVHQATAAEPELQELAAKSESRELDLLTDAIAHLGWRDRDDARLHALLLLAQLQRAFDYWSLRKDEFDRDDLIDALTESWWHTLHRAGQPRA
jgi:AcrR family transcriptional regulator